jgi:hypothetical protein
MRLPSLEYHAPESLEKSTDIQERFGGRSIASQVTWEISLNTVCQEDSL